MSDRQNKPNTYQYANTHSSPSPRKGVRSSTHPQIIPPHRRTTGSSVTRSARARAVFPRAVTMAAATEGSKCARIFPLCSAWHMNEWSAPKVALLDHGPWAAPRVKTSGGGPDPTQLVGLEGPIRLACDREEFRTPCDRSLSTPLGLPRVTKSLGKVRMAW